MNGYTIPILIAIMIVIVVGVSLLPTFIDEATDNLPVQIEEITPKVPTKSSSDTGQEPQEGTPFIVIFNTIAAITISTVIAYVIFKRVRIRNKKESQIPTEKAKLSIFGKKIK